MNPSTVADFLSKVKEFLLSVGLEQGGTVAELRDRVAEYLENRKKKHFKNAGKRGVDDIKLEET